MTDHARTIDADDQAAAGRRPVQEGTPAPSGTRVPGPKALYRVAATAEMFTWALLILAMVLKYSGTTEALMPVAGGVHGFAFLAYCLVAVAVGVNQRWGAGRGIVAVLLAVVPFATLPFDRWLERRGEPDSTWRLVDGRSEPRGIAERLEALALRRPLTALVAAVAVVAVVFTALLTAGPPDQWFA
jgi:integral membrane protein